MKPPSDSLYPLLSVIVALHVALFSMVVGSHHLGYILTVTLSATLIWGMVFFRNAWRRHAAVITGVVFAVVVQQAAYGLWKAQLPGCWWPLAQSGALHFLVAFGLRRIAP